MNTENMKLFLEKIKSDPSRLATYCDMFVNSVPQSNNSFKSFHLPVTLNINGVSVPYTVDTSLSVHDFLETISSQFSVPGNLYIGFPDLIDKIFHSRKISNFVLFPKQTITVKSVPPVPPTIPRECTTDFPWEMFFVVFGELLEKKVAGMPNQLLRVLSNIPSPLFSFPFNATVPTLLAIFFSHFEYRVLKIAHNQLVQALDFCLTQEDPTVRLRTVIAVLKLCVFNDVKLSGDEIAKVERAVVDKAVFCYLGCCAEKETRTDNKAKKLSVVDRNAFEVIGLAQSGLEMSLEDVSLVVNDILKGLKSGINTVVKLTDFFDTPLSFTMNENGAFDEDLNTYALLYLLNEITTKFGFKVVTQKLCMLLCSYVLPQYGSIEENTVVMLGPQSINLVYSILGKSERVKKVIGDSVVKSVNIQTKLGKVELSYHSTASSDDKKITNAIFIVASLLKEGETSCPLAKTSEVFSRFPPRSVDVSELVSLLLMSENGVVLLAKKNGISMCELNFTPIDEPKIVINEICKTFIGKVFTYEQNTEIYATTKRPMHFEVKDEYNEFGKRFVLKALITNDNIAFIRNGNNWFTVVGGALQLVPPKLLVKMKNEAKFSDVFLSYEEYTRDNTSHKKSVEVLQEDIGDVIVRTSSHAIQFLCVEEKTKLLDSLIKRYNDLIESSVYLTVIESFTKDDPFMVIQNLVCDEFVDFMKTGETSSQIQESLINVVYNVLKVIENEDQLEAVLALVFSKDPSAGLLKLCLKAINVSGVKQYLVCKLGEFFQFKGECKKELCEIIKQMKGEIAQMKELYKANVEFIRSLKEDIPDEARLILGKVGNDEERTCLVSPSRFMMLTDEQKFEFFKEVDLSEPSMEQLKIIQQYKKDLVEPGKELLDKFDQINAIFKTKFADVKFYDDCFDIVC
ncbi:hypothetical protein EIN_162460 [Entamoeba invadens IP1]|uniref:Uncharacterized protein n=1 Tax=Entamoeba invadens IP1 TaxID=370355 RepID=A0A0A1U1V6_ENTIV|nr:hypothetical protein EIN_162460 [Entamoeba invadens IP1]ELP86602.1 hypothetical protein EIN_162460 [Entamoeba invadens IP1]|eukprot:XP_004185948.1 hypothetical protein EIN_162460 [Entamoeba invadens IP1]